MCACVWGGYQEPDWGGLGGSGNLTVGEGEGCQEPDGGGAWWVVRNLTVSDGGGLGKIGNEMMMLGMLMMMMMMMLGRLKMMMMMMLGRLTQSSLLGKWLTAKYREASHVSQHRCSPSSYQ